MDSHAVVIARRSLLVFLYKQLGRLFEARDSIFEYCEGGEGVEKMVLTATSARPRLRIRKGRHEKVECPLKSRLSP